MAYTDQPTEYKVQKLEEAVGTVPANKNLQGEIDALSANITTLSNQIGNLNTALNGNSLRFTGTLGKDVITAANECVIGLTFYINSNRPVNHPSSIEWGAYLFMKSSSTNISIFCWDNSHFACVFSLDPTTATSINWNVIK